MSKLSVASAAYERYEKYYLACEDLSKRINRGAGAYAPRPDNENSGKNCYVLFTANRGLCGSFNHDMQCFFNETLRDEKDPKIVICGKWGRRRCSSEAEYFEISDVPTTAEANVLFKRLAALYTEEKYDRVIFVYYRLKNLLIGAPATETVLPVQREEGEADGDILYLPSSESAAERALEMCVNARVYGLLLKSAIGAHAASLAAMRSASDNSEHMISELKLELNRMRQATVTAGVIEAAGASGASGMS